MEATTKADEALKVMCIELRLAEGTPAETARPSFADSWEGAARQLTIWASKAPSMGYLKCDFRIVFQDSHVYCGRYDLTDLGRGCPNLRGHVRSMCDFYCGDERPAHMSETEYRAFLADESDIIKRAYRRLRAHYDI